MLCLLGRHRPEKAIVCNHGYRFSCCRRCGADIVNPVTGGWHKPAKGFRVVWRPSGEAAAAFITPRISRPTAPPVLRKVERQGSADFMSSDEGGFDWMTKIRETPDPSPRRSA